MGGIPHFLAIPYPILGHVNPLMQFCQVLAKHGCKITFVNTEFNHKRFQSAGPGPGPGPDNLNGSLIKFVTLPDGLGPEDDRSDLTKILLSIDDTMPTMLPKLIQDVNTLDVDNKISCIIVTIHISWALEVGHKLGIKRALLFPASATSMTSCYCVPRLIHHGIIDSDGLPIKKQEIQIYPNMPMMDPADLPWAGLDKIFFGHTAHEIQTTLKSYAEWWLCNTICDLEPEALSISPKFLPIGPLMECDTNTRSSFWLEDTSCIDWLDQHPPHSVIYVSFGSLAALNPTQFKELALALDLLNKPFLLVVRPVNDNKVNNTYPDEFQGSKGKIVNWAPQKKILNHPAIGCFISHCGWNSSTVEGVYSGTPFLCWPFCSDQFVNRSYICNAWKVGLGLENNENGLISKEEIRKKVDQLLGDEDIRARSLKLKELTINNIAKGGQSSKNIEKFINWAKE